MGSPRFIQIKDSTNKNYIQLMVKRISKKGKWKINTKISLSMEEKHEKNKIKRKKKDIDRCLLFFK